MVGSPSRRGLCVIDARQRIVQANPALARLVGKQQARDIVGLPLGHFLDRGIDALLARARRERAPLHAHLRSADKRRKIPVLVAFHDVDAGNRRRSGAVVVITVRGFGDRIATSAYSAQLEVALDVGQLGAWGLNLRTGEAWRTDLHDRIFGYEHTQPRWTYEKFLAHVIPVDRERVNRTFKQATRAHQRWAFDCRIQRTDGDIRWIAIQGGFEDDIQGDPAAVFGVIADITERKRAEAQVEFLAYYDSLTHLPNRRLLDDRLAHAVVHARRQRRFGAILFLDLDDFKSINDTQGHHVGDEMLVEAARRLCDCLREDDTVARFGGDEFVVVLEDLGTDRDAAAASAAEIAGIVRTALLAPFELSTIEQRRASCSIGGVIFGDNDCEATTLLQQADVAMYRAKAKGGDGLCLYEPQMQQAIDSRVAIEREIQQGIENDEFVLYYQPQLDLAANSVKAEALLRWHHPSRGVVYPGDFIAVAEACGLIVPLGRQVIEQACRRLREWSRSPAMSSISIAVNVSASQFHDPSFTRDITTAIERFAIDPRRLVIELTESVLLDSIERARAIMAELAVRGVRFALDDFGTGYSSLYYLKNLPLHQLKIDRRFVSEALTDPHDAAIVHTIITLAQAMGMEVVAEGVESVATRDFLLAGACVQQQGFLFSKALTADRFEAYVRADPFAKTRPAGIGR
ncbi:EAL domain-containing protein [Salinisphaera sp. T5B8]|uniref:putative bifunctional diguanylate cyclase/phosphodiesterase n=1 Tax=Salinisphaera sp. T5B8 TaxID=1304154 RepID=UPI00333F9D72